MPTFEEVVACVRGERAYQETRWLRPLHAHSLTEYLVFIDHYVKNAMAIVSKEDGDKGSLDDFRKITARANNEIMSKWKEIPVLDPNEVAKGWISYRIRWDLMGEFLGIDHDVQTTRALAKTPSPRYVIHKCSRAGCGKHLFFYYDGVDPCPDVIVDHYLNDHSLFARSIVMGFIPLHTQLTEFVREF